MLGELPRRNARTIVLAFVSMLVVADRRSSPFAARQGKDSATMLRLVDAVAARFGPAVVFNDERTIWRRAEMSGSSHRGCISFCSTIHIGDFSSDPRCRAIRTDGMDGLSFPRDDDIKSFAVKRAHRFYSAFARTESPFLSEMAPSQTRIIDIDFSW